MDLSTMLLVLVGVGGAEAGTLTFMVGGEQSHFDAAQQYLKAMGKNIVHCGDAGTGQVCKCVQYKRIMRGQTSLPEKQNVCHDILTKHTHLGHMVF